MYIYICIYIYTYIYIYIEREREREHCKHPDSIGGCANECARAPVLHHGPRLSAKADAFEILAACV